MKRYPLLILSLAFFCAIHAQKDNGSAQVKTINGFVAGVVEKSNILAFKGIPFAAPPIGEWRWREPQPVKNWDGVKQTTEFGPKPMQTAVFGDMNSRAKTMSEDCLYLNVWTPGKGKKLLPVLVYFYGGGLVAGDGAEPRYDGESMAQKGIVALTVNYRLGVFGFLSHPELSAASPYKGSGNYGLLDQWAALKWVQQNIAAFGGDPQRVTIAGESAGSISVSAQMASPLAKNLIAGAIGESGSILGTLPAVPLKEAEQTGVDFANTLKASSIKELRALNADSLLQAAARFNPFRFSISIDGYFFPKSPYEIYRAGKQANIPLLAGWNNEEMSFHAVMGNEKLTKENFAAAVKRLYKDKAEEVLRVYHPATDEEVEQVATDLASDRFIAFSTWNWINLHGRMSPKKIYRYIFERARPAMRVGSATPAKGAVHSAEIEYAMGNLGSNTVYAWTADDYQVSKIMQDYFARFIITGDPNDKGLPVWPALNKGMGSTMYIDVNTRAEKQKHEGRYFFMYRASQE